MYLIFRPRTPPFALAYLRYASMPRATVPAIAASPLSGTLEPIVIWVDVTPGVAVGRAPAPVARTAPTSMERSRTLTTTYDLLYNRLVSGPKSLRNAPPM